MSGALVTAIAAGDAGAFAQWMRGAERPLRESLRRFAASVDTEAVLQETLLRIWQVAPRFEDDGRPEGLLRLAFRIAHNLAISEIRKTRRLDPTELQQLERLQEEASAHVRPHEPDPLLRRLIAACRDQLPEKPLLALRARLESGGRDPDATVAERLRMKKNTFLQNITRARRLLAECLRRRGVEVEPA